MDGITLLDLKFGELHNKIYNKRIEAKKCGREFTIGEVSEILAAMNLPEGTCAYSGKRFQDLGDITFERIDPNKGYVPGNVVFVSKAANDLKARLDAFEKSPGITDEMKLKLLRKAAYRMSKRIEGK
ncbi:hypothetical protein ACVOZ6_003539 [Escherichia coli]